MLEYQTSELFNKSTVLLTYIQRSAQAQYTDGFAWCRNKSNKKQILVMFITATCKLPITTPLFLQNDNPLEVLTIQSAPTHYRPLSLPPILFQTPLRRTNNRHKQDPYRSPLRRNWPGSRPPRRCPTGSTAPLCLPLSSGPRSENDRKGGRERKKERRRRAVTGSEPTPIEMISLFGGFRAKRSPRRDLNTGGRWGSFAWAWRWGRPNTPNSHLPCSTIPIQNNNRWYPNPIKHRSRDQPTDDRLEPDPIGHNWSTNNGNLNSHKRPRIPDCATNERSGGGDCKLYRYYWIKHQRMMWGWW